MKLYNGRIIHIEDLLFEGKEGFETLQSVIYDVTRLTTGASLGDTQLSIKIDGAPSIIFGKHPENKDFFLGTKSVFNKEPKVNFSHEDINRNHNGSVNRVLHDCFDYLPRIDGIVQADVLFIHSDLFWFHKDDVEYLGCQPNTILYGVPSDSQIAKNMEMADIGFVYHTVYSDLTVESASLDTKGVSFAEFPEVWCRDASITLTPKFMKESHDLSHLYSGLCDLHHNEAFQSLLQTIPTKSYLQKGLREYIYSCIRTSQRPSKIGFHFFTENQYNDKISSLTKEDSKQNKLDEKKTVLKEQKACKALNDLFVIWNVIYDFKTEILMPAFNQTQFSLESFLANDKGEINSCKPEGYVLNNKDYTVKFVDRFEFTKANYENDRWN